MRRTSAGTEHSRKNAASFRSLPTTRFRKGGKCSERSHGGGQGKRVGERLEADAQADSRQLDECGRQEPGERGCTESVPTPSVQDGGRKVVPHGGAGSWWLP